MGIMPSALPTLPGSWNAALGAEVAKPYFRELWNFVTAERATKQIFPPADEVFNALAFTPLEKVKVVILGQDPYHDDGQAHGLCFSVRRGIKPPPSLVNIFKELETDVGIPRPDHGCLEAWAKQGVLLLNAVLTVRAHEPNSHKDRGWETFTDAVVKAVDARKDPVVFALWGASAQKKASVVDATRHIVLKSAHPSPLSARLFLGSKPFSAINAALEKAGKTPIDWRL
jgi:uracil-DNA glycosylase